MSEDVWPFINAMSSGEDRTNEIQENVYLEDLRLFLFCAEVDHVYFICPQSVSADFLSYYKELFNNRHVTVITMAHHSGEICEDILHDESVMKKFIEIANSSRRLTVTSYATTPQFLTLVRELRKRGLTIYTPEAPEEEDGWTVNFYGSKSGIRQLAQQSKNVEPDFHMADGLICVGIEDAAKIAAKRYIKENGVVIKTNKGHSGMGVLLFRPGELPADYLLCEEKILTILKKEAYWSKFPIIIEDYIQIQSSIGGGCPNVEFKILKNGRVDFLYYCAMRMTENGVFKGVEIHNEVVSDRVAAQMVDTGFFVGEQYASAGYRGYYDVDFVAGKNGQLYVTESNVRSTGGTFVYTTALRLFGKDFMYTTYIISNNSYNISHLPKQTFSQIQERLQSVLFNKISREGLVIMSENLLRIGHLAYIIFGKNKKHAIEIELNMEALLRA
ncbi:hypothetical protein A3A63_01795 [Candidatus Gottesmanbacteria bacterium RIFCSPLOWO2_01_FULL_46_9]|uniref:ATP-grasp domain-containing protein n=1 Tax=Candidatus Gottesmanbacteria bacterium RIFCSPLOWO2_01_FULL_46_9 TaxID=1798394 RepID=A0A1F6B3K6_9BACT|nr:MAG: hypothetical protein A3A63_01795 [Candidatus Gottesmanbacteria bacterium RIFCSPLOWO2_01_FULL_46_9]